MGIDESRNDRARSRVDDGRACRRQVANVIGSTHRGEASIFDSKCFRDRLRWLGGVDAPIHNHEVGVARWGLGSDRLLASGYEAGRQPRGQAEEFAARVPSTS